jgi:hypothetical protein
MQFSQLAPPFPHEVRLVPGLQELPATQQPAQPLDVSQMHAPPLQRSPAPHGLPEPHMHPPLVQRSAFEPQAAH